MEIDELKAQIIIGAISVCYSEGQWGINGNPSYEKIKQYIQAESEIVEYLNNKFPELIEKYNYLPVVQKIKSVK